MSYSSSSSGYRHAATKKQFLFASDFDKTLSFNDSGYVISDLVGVRDFEARVEKVSKLNLVQQGGELAYLLVHDPDFRNVRRDHLREAGKRINLKHNIERLSRLLEEGFDEMDFAFYVISAAPQEVIQSALEGIVPKEHIVGAQFTFAKEDAAVDASKSLEHVPAGYGKVAVLRTLQEKLQIADDRVIYSGDGSSDIHVMLHINQRKGYTIAVSQTQYVAQIAKRTVLSDDACSVLIPVLEDICQWEAGRIRAFFEAQDLLIQEWVKMRTDWLTIRSNPR